MDTRSTTNAILEIIDNAGREGMNCGQILEILTNVNSVVAQSLAKSLNLEPAEIVSDIASFTLETFRKDKSEDKDE